MKTCLKNLPASQKEASTQLRIVLRNRHRLAELSTSEFCAGYQAIFFLAPGLHPDEADHHEGGWPVGWRSIAEEAFRRAGEGNLTDEQLYPYEASQAGIKLRCAT